MKFLAFSTISMLSLVTNVFAIPTDQRTTEMNNSDHIIDCERGEQQQDLQKKTESWINRKFGSRVEPSSSDIPPTSEQGQGLPRPPPAQAQTAAPKNRHRRITSINQYVSTPGITPHQANRDQADLPYSGQMAIPKARNKYAALGINALIEFMGSIFFYLPAYIGSDPSKGDGYVAAVYAASLTVAVFAFAQGHFNHGVTFSQLLQGAISPEQAALFVLSQYSASLAAGGLSFAATGQFRSIASLHGINVGQGFLVELIGSIFLQLIVMMSSVMKHSSSILAPLLIGLCFLSLELFGIPLTGASYNGARQFGAAAVSNNWHHYDWIYHVAPLVATPCSVFLFKLLQIAQLPTDTDVSFGPGLALRTIPVEGTDRTVHVPVTNQQSN